MSARTVKERAIEAQLNQEVSVDFDKKPLSEVVDFLAKYTGLNVVLDPGGLAEAGGSEQSPVTLRVKDVKLRDVLKLMLKPMGMTYTIRHDVLLLTSPQINRSDLISRYYYVGDLVIAPTMGTANPSMNPSSAQVNPNYAGTLGNPNVPNPGANPAAPANMANNMPTGLGERPNVDFSPLIHLIKATVSPGSWRNDDGASEPGPSYGMGAGYGGGAADEAETAAIGSITPFFLNISLIIRHTAEVHDEIVDLLRQLRRLQDLQVTIEVRFITVSDSFFEQIGIDFDFAVDSKSVGKKSSFAANAAGSGNLFNGSTTTTNTTTGTTQPAYNINPQYSNSIGTQPIVAGLSGPGDPNYYARQSANAGGNGQLSIPFSQDSYDQIAPFNAVPGGGASFGIAFLSDLEVYFFMMALQGDTRSNLVQAPKVTTFNGALATINSSNVINYVAALIPIVGAGAVVFEPIPRPLLDGVFLFVTPVVLPTGAMCE